MSFIRMDFNEELEDNDNDTKKREKEGEFPKLDKRCFDLIVDKSTLDCALCSKDDDAVRLLCMAYRYLKPPPLQKTLHEQSDNNYHIHQQNENETYYREGLNVRQTEEGGGGVYAVISFHPPDFLQPLLQNLPGASWNVEHYTVLRDKAFSKQKSRDLGEIETNTTACNDNINDNENSAAEKNENNSFAWSNGSFQPNDEYKRTVHVYLCQRKHALHDQPQSEKSAMKITFGQQQQQQMFKDKNIYDNVLDKHA
eukprot:10598549-Ditylum_brightwellii.AAC.1